jgi:hypothetical protein
MTDPRFAEAARDNGFVRSARQTKAAGLQIALDKFSVYRGEPVTAVALMGWNETSWQLLACIAAVNPPSSETKSIVIERLAARDAAILAANGAGR